MSTHGPIEAGGRFGNLEIEAEIGSGGFGVVYRAKDVLIGRRVALKVVRDLGLGPLPAETRRKILAEAQALGRLAHPNVATLYRVHALEDGGLMLELEYVEGASLETILKAGDRLPVTEAVSLARDLASGLRAAHAAHLAHGDVKPANVLRRSDGVVKIVDFGLARNLGSENRNTSTTHVAGTPQYMAPEVINGEGHVPASDVWGLGAVLYRALSGRLPFDAPSIVPLFYAILETTPKPLPDDVPPGIRQLVLACLAKRPEERPVLDDAFFEALDQRRHVIVAPVELAKPSPTATLVGREAECARLWEAIARVAAGATDLVAITGPAGIGKSRLTAFAGAAAHERGFAVVTATASSVEGVVRPLHRALMAASTASAGSTSGWSAPTSRSGAESRGGRGRAAGPADVERRLVALAEKRPVLVVVEDLHRATAEDVRALGRLAARLEGSRALFLVTERVPDLDVSANTAPRVESLLADGRTRLDVGPLSRDALHELLERVSGDAQIDADVLERAVRRSGGNPLFALEIFAHERATTSKTSVADAIAAPPPVLRDALARRLRGLPETLREVLDVASVDGFEFDAESIAEVLRVPALDVLRRLQRLARAHRLVVAREHGHRFAHPLMQEVVYAEVAPELRRVLHRALAEHLERRGEAVDPERLGTHWERAGEHEKAMPRLLEAAHRAAGRLENWRCVDLSTRAGIVPGKTPVETVLRHTQHVFDFASAASDLGRRADRDALYADVARAASASGNQLLSLQLAARRGITHVLGTGLQEGDEAALRDAAAALPDGVELGIAAYALGLVEKYRSRRDEAEAWIRRADEVFVRNGVLARHASALDQLASLALRAGHPREAARGYREAARVCREAGQGANAEISDTNAVLVELELGEIEGTAARLEKAARLMAIDGVVGASVQVRAVLARVHLALGQPAQARSLAAHAIAEARRLSLWIVEFEALMAGADIAAIGGSLEDAERLGEAAERLATEQGRGLDQVRPWRVLEAALRGDEATAILRLREATNALVGPAERQARLDGVRTIAEAAAVLANADLSHAVEELGREFETSADDRDSWRITTSLVEIARARRSGDAERMRGAAEALDVARAGLHRPLFAALREVTAPMPPTSDSIADSAPAALVEERNARWQALGVGSVARWGPGPTRATAPPRD